MLAVMAIKCPKGAPSRYPHGVGVILFIIRLLFACGRTKVRPYVRM